MKQFSQRQRGAFLLDLFRSFFVSCQFVEDSSSHQIEPELDNIGMTICWRIMARLCDSRTNIWSAVCCCPNTRYGFHRNLNRASDEADDSLN